MAEAVAGWTDERVELLGKLWAEGLSASQIAGVLGGGVTRNAVIGKVHRLGLAARGKTGPSSTPRPAKPRPVAAAPAQAPASASPEGGRQVHALFDGVRAEPRPPSPEIIDIPVSERISIQELRESSCRWPLGDPTSPDFGFCGGRAATGHPYCEPHCRIAYQPVTERRRLRA